MDWTSASCGNLQPAQADKLFFLTRGGSPKRAALFCANCPLLTECRNYAILYEERGIWGGMTEDERDELATWVRPMLLEKALAEGTLEVRPDPAQLVQQAVPLVEDYDPIFRFEAS